MEKLEFKTRHTRNRAARQSGPVASNSSETTDIDNPTLPKSLQF
jgi:hypothetical protein